MPLRSFFICLLWIFSGYADLEDHLQKISDKSTLKTIDKIDCIYLINLDERPEKWSQSINQLAPFGIYPCRFSAVNGWKLSLETLNDVGLKFSPGMHGDFLGTCYNLNQNFEPSHEMIQCYGKNYFCHCMSRGAIGIALSHLSILQDAFDSQYDTIWVMEDDIDVKKDPRIISSLIDKLDALIGPDNWDILFTDRDIRNIHGNYVPTFYAGKRPDLPYPTRTNNYALREEISPEFIKIGARSGAHSMVLRKKGIRKLLEFCKAHQIFFPYDMEYILPEGICLYTVQEDVVSNLPNASSDNGGPNYNQTQPR
jgi:GR25 family glycosyltransferase involved in LPS biosynthesis